MKNSWLKGYVYDLFVSYETVDFSYIVNIHKYLMKKIQYGINA